MKLKYEKTASDSAREKSDLERSPIMRFLKHQEYYKFNIGDILVKQRRFTHLDAWKADVIPGVNSPKKFMYVFENELGIGYLKQLRVDGSGFTSDIICTANFDPDTVKFTLDPDFVDHMLIGGEEFEYNSEYLNKKAFREEAIKKNTKLLVKTRNKWISSLKEGDVFWAGWSFDNLCDQKYKVKERISDESPLKVYVEILEYSPDRYVGNTQFFDEGLFTNMKVSMQQPFPMEDPLCGQAK